MRIFYKILTAVLFLQAVTLTINVSAQYAIEKELGSKALGLLQFNSPRGVVSESNGNFYVIDARTVYRMSPSGEVIHQWTHPSDYMVSIAQDEDDNVIIAGYTRIFRLTSDLQLINEFGTFGYEDGQITGTIDIATDSINQIYVLDRLSGTAPSQGTFRVQVFSPDGTFLNKPISSSAGYYNSDTDYLTIFITNLAVHSNNLALASYQYDFGSNTQSQIFLYTLTGEFQNTIGSLNSDESRIFYPSGLSFDIAGNLLVADVGRVIRFALDGTYLTSFNVPGMTPGIYRNTVDIAEEPDHTILLCDYGSERVIERVSNTGVSITKFGRGDGDGQFRYPIDVAKDSKGNIYVMDMQNYRVQKLDSVGNFILQFGSLGTEQGQFNIPRKIEIDKNDNVWIMDNPKILKFDSLGNFILSFGSYGTGDGEFYYTVDFELDSDDNIYVLNTNFSDLANVQKFDNTGHFISKFGKIGDGPGDLNNVVALAVDHHGDIYINDISNSLGGFRIQRLTNDGTYIETTPYGIYSYDLEVDKYNNLYGRGYNSVLGITAEGITKYMFSGTGDNEFLNGGFYIDPSTQKIIVTGQESNNVLILSCSLPKAIFSVTPALAGSPTIFTDESTQVAPSATYKWEFGDGAISDIRGNTDHIYTETKEYTTTLAIDQTCVSEFSKTFNLTTSLESDSLALVDFYNNANGANWVNKTNWLTGDIGTWYGVVLKNGRVAGLEFRSNNNIQGGLPSSMSQLEKLERLVITNNSIENGVPTWIGKPKELNTLVLSNNQLTGKLPDSIGSLTKLDTLDLSSNHFSDSIPESLGQLTLLRYLDLTNNNLEKGVPSSFSNLDNAVAIKLARNHLNRLPNLSSIASLQTLAVEYNHLSFGDIESNMSIEHFSYSPQFKISVPDSSIISYETGALNLTVPVSGSSNQYQWYKDSQAIDGATSSVYSASNITQANAGQYHLQITNSLVPGLTLQSFEISVSIVTPPDNDHDGYTVVSDCNDDDPSIYPGAEELCDAIDNNCDGIIDNGCTSAQFWGMNFTAGPAGAGSIFSIYADGSQALQVQHAFKISYKTPARENLLELSDGSFAGMVSYGGVYEFGGIFKIDKDGRQEIIFNFNGLEGRYPFGALILGQDGMLYGMTSEGGQFQYGTIFKINTNGTGHTVIHSFDYTNGGIPFGSLVQSTDGQLYGMTLAGGASQVGSIFKIRPDGTEFTLMHNFTSADGVNPQGSLIQTPEGDLFGLTREGGLNGYGTLFKIDSDGISFSVLRHFNGLDGNFATGNLLLASNNKIYGMASNGGMNNVGSIFSINPDGTSFSVIHDFNRDNGAIPIGALIEANDNKLYGLTQWGGAFSNGTIFSIELDGSNQSVLRSFNNPSGGVFYGGSLIQASDGKLYGATQLGGVSNSGTIFKIDKSGSEFETIYDFGNLDGIHPSGSLVKTSAGKLFGITRDGGVNNLGTVFKINPDGKGYSMIHSFNGADGSNPRSSLVEGTDGSLYGVTPVGGSFNNGALFKINQDGTGYTVLHNFSAEDGSFPYGSPLFLSNNVLYGLTTEGGTSGVGVLYKIDSDGAGYTVLHNFSNDNGGFPFGSLIQASNGLLYGMTNSGGWSNFGTVFKINPDGTGYDVIYNFDSNSGSRPMGSLTQAPDGYFYGMTREGGSSYGGTLFRLSENGLGYAVLVNFGSYTSAGFAPSGSLTLYKNRLYGLTSAGGSFGGGVVFNYDLAVFQYNKIVDLSDYTGRLPDFGNLILVNPQQISTPTQGASNISFRNVTNQSMTINFKPGNGEKRVVLMAEESPELTSVSIMNGTELSGNSNFALASIYQTGWKVVYAGNDSVVNISGLRGSINYHVTVIEYNGEFTDTYYRNNDAPLATQRTRPDVFRPTVDASGITFSNVTPTSMRVSFTPGDGEQRLAVMRMGGIPTFSPYDDTFYSGWQYPDAEIVYNGSGNSFDLSYLQPNTVYYIKIYEFNTDSTQTRYLLLNPPVASQQTTALPDVYVTTPGDGASNQGVDNLKVTARKLDKAKTYTIEISPFSDFREGVKTQSGSRTLTFSGLVLNTTYFARVKTDLSPYYGKVTSFTTAPASQLAYVISPKNGAVNVATTVTVSANPLSAATTYVIELNSSKNFDGIWIEKTANSPNIVFTGLSAKTTYYARVLTDISLGEWGKTTSFTTGNQSKSNLAARDSESTEEDEFQSDPFTVEILENPFRQRLTLTIKTPAEEEATLKLSDMTGKIIFQSSEKTNRTIEIDKPIVQGVYLVHVRTASGSKIMRVVKVD